MDGEKRKNRKRTSVPLWIFVVLALFCLLFLNDQFMKMIIVVILLFMMAIVSWKAGQDYL